jgi:uncharacterized protein (TIGR01244 family)
MSDFRRLSEGFWASPQLDTGDVEEASEKGFSLVINNRPEDEAADQPSGESIREAARQAGLGYAAIPITHAGFSEAQVEELTRLLGETDGKILAYCRSGTRSTLLWALAQANMGRDPDEIARAAEAAGYDVSPVRPAMDMFAARAGS